MMVMTYDGDDDIDNDDYDAYVAKLLIISLILRLYYNVMINQMNC